MGHFKISHFEKARLRKMIHFEISHRKGHFEKCFTSKSVTSENEALRNQSFRKSDTSKKRDFEKWPTSKSVTSENEALRNKSFRKIDAS